MKINKILNVINTIKTEQESIKTVARDSKHSYTDNSRFEELNEIIEKAEKVSALLDEVEQMLTSYGIIKRTILRIWSKFGGGK